MKTQDFHAIAKVYSPPPLPMEMSPPLSRERGNSHFAECGGGEYKNSEWESTKSIPKERGARLKMGWVIAILLLPLISFSQTEFLTSAPWIEELREEAVPADAEYNGDFVAGATWKDYGGTNYFIVSEIEDEKMLKNDLYVYQYVANEVGMKLVWDIKDFSHSLANVHVVEYSLQVIDLDGDELMETSFIYHFPSDGMDPTVVKLMFHSKGKKLAIRGEIPVMEGEGELVKNIDAAVKEYPALFGNFISAEWDEYVKNEGDIEFAKSVNLRGDNFILLERWYNYASGGTSYQLLDKNGKPKDLPGDLETRLSEAVEVLPLKDGRRLIYDNHPKLGMVDLESNTGADLVTFYEDTEALSSVVQSPSGKKVAFFALNQNYPNGTKLFVLTLDGLKVVNKQKFDLPTFRMAASAWIVESPRFVDDNVIEYRHWTNPEEEGVMKRVTIE